MGVVGGMSSGDLHQTSSDSVIVDPIDTAPINTMKNDLHVKHSLLSMIEKNVRKEYQRPERNWFQLVYQRLLVIFITALVLIFGCLGNIFQICTVPLMLINRPMVLRWHSYLAGFIWSIMQFTIHENLSGLRISFSGLENIPDSENAFVISNHVSFADYSIVNAIATRKKMISFCKYFVKVLYVIVDIVYI
jgi:hypothetical protein